MALTPPWRTLSREEPLQRISEKEALGFVGSEASLSNHPLSSPLGRTPFESSFGVSQAWAETGGFRRAPRTTGGQQGYRVLLTICGPISPSVN